MRLPAICSEHYWLQVASIVCWVEVQLMSAHLRVSQIVQTWWCTEIYKHKKGLQGIMLLKNIFGYFNIFSSSESRRNSVSLLNPEKSCVDLLTINFMKLSNMLGATSSRLKEIYKWNYSINLILWNVSKYRLSHFTSKFQLTSENEKEIIK